MKARMKSFLASRIFLYPDLQRDFAIQSGLEPMSEATQRRLQEVIIELLDEWKK